MFRPAATTKKLNDKFHKSCGRRSWLTKFKSGSIRVFIWEITLNYFFLLSTSLQELGPERDNVVVAFKQLAEEYGNKLKKRHKSGRLK